MHKADDEDVERHRATPAWDLLWGPDRHFGYFATGDESLAEASLALTQELITLAGISRGMRVLDVGCGTGHTTRYVASITGARIVGISNNAASISAARIRGGDSNNVTFEVRDALDTKFEGGAFDVVWCVQISHQILEKSKLFGECARILKPGGRLVVADYVLLSPFSWREVLEKRADFALLHKVFGEAKVESFDSYRKTLVESGLGAIEVFDVSAAASRTLHCWRENTVQHRDRLLEMMGESRLAAFSRACDILESFWRAQRYGYGLMRAVRN